MQLVTKAAIGVGVVVIGLGTYYAATQMGAGKSQEPGQMVAPKDQDVLAVGPSASPGPVDRTSRQAQPTRKTPAPSGTVERGPRTPEAGTSALGPATRPEQAHPVVGVAPPSVGPTTRPTVMPQPPTTAPAIADRSPAMTPPISTGPLTAPVESSTVASPVAPSPTVPMPTPTVGNDPAKVNKEHVIQPGDTFSGLAVKYFGHAKYADLIQNANPDRDPRKLRPGMKIVIPPNPDAASGSAVVPSPVPSVTPSPAPSPLHTGAEPARMPDLSRMLSARRLPSPEPAAAERAYTVKAGDNWEALSKRFMGTANWTELFEHNKERLKGDRRNLRPGLVIELPEGANLAALNTASTKPASR